MTSVNNIETEFLELNEKNQWQLFYQRIRVESAKNSKPSTEASKPQNKIFNRYRDVSPYDHSRIILQRGSTDYINANLIKVDKAKRQYILTQGPLSNTVAHFWLMVWEQNTKAILMLNKLIEKKQEKCFQYWPTKIGPEHALKWTDVGLSIEYTEHQDHSYYLTRTLRLTDLESRDSRDIIQFHYTTWPDFGVPSSPTAFLEFLRRVRDAGVLEETVGPAIVHCSAGIGRSGTFCLVDSCLVLIEKYGINSFDVKDVLLEMRGYRMGLIQTPEQLRFSYQAIIEGAKQLLDPDSHLLNENHLDIDITNSICEEEVDEVSESSEDDGPPPLPPPRLDSLKRQNGTPLDRPLPNIPNSVSLNNIELDDSDEMSYNQIGPLPVVPADEEELTSEEDELEKDTEDSLLEENTETLPKSDEELSPSELRHRKRLKHKEHIESLVRDMKRRQQIHEQWTQLKRPKTTLED